jgi:hypothetical protein
MLVRYYGHVGQTTGYGVAGAELCHALLSAGVDLEICPPSASLAQPGPLAAHYRAETAGKPTFVNSVHPRPDAIIVHTLPMDCKKVLNAGSWSGEPALVAYTTWEGSDPIPYEMWGAMECFQEVWTPSAQNTAYFRHGGVQSAHTIPHAYDESARATAVRAVAANEPEPSAATSETADFISTSPYRFLYVGAWCLRKNPVGLIRAYFRAFSSSDPVALLIQSIGVEERNIVMARAMTGVPPDKQPRVLASSAMLSDEEMATLYQSSDCFVSATRGEAWNLPAFDAMMAGCHVIHPGGTGADDFLMGTSADRYKNFRTPAYGEVQVLGEQSGQLSMRYMGAQGLSCHHDWLEPDLSDLANRMRRAFLESKKSIAIGYDPAAKFGRRVVGQMMLDRLSELVK